MATYLGFLRAINLGPNRRFPKAAIVAATEAAGFRDVATHIASGNVRFDTTMRSRARIEDAEISDGHQGARYVSLLKQEPSAALARQIEALSTDRDVARVRGRAVHLL